MYEKHFWRMVIRRKMGTRTVAKMYMRCICDVYGDVNGDWKETEAKIEKRWRITLWEIGTRVNGRGRRRNGLLHYSNHTGGDSNLNNGWPVSLFYDFIMVGFYFSHF